MGEFVRLEVDQAVGVIHLDRPPANAFSLQMSVELLETVQAAAEDDRVGAIVVSGGDRLFAAGADIKEMADHGPQEIASQVEALGGACDLLERIDKISIAAISGVALGGGLEVALGCDLRYLADTGRVGQPEILLGVIPGAGGTQRLVRHVGPGRTRELVYTGRQVAATEALQLGIADKVLPAEEVFATAVEDAGSFARGPRRALAAAKTAIRAASERPGAAGLQRERELFVQLFGTPDQREGMRAFLDKRPPVFGSDPS
jgi:enoyl-CoA hydratase/carnithine racemase